MKQFIILLKKDFIEIVRTKKILIISAIFFIFALTSPVIAKMTPELIKSLGGELQISLPEATIIDSYIQFIKNITQICSWTLIIALSGFLVYERRSGLYNNLLNNGVKKKNFILSKVTIQILLVTAIYIISCVLFSVYNYILFGEALIKYSILSLLSTYIYLLFIISFINLFGVISKSSVSCIMLGIGTTIIISIFDLFKFGKYMPNYLINIASNIFKDTLYLDYVYINIGFTIFLSLMMIWLSIKLCKNKDY